ncbi:[Fe-Fe] hydrogenase large subunit C-terminal domain-containing protein [Megasphaera vaginalis (ex Srinivasan et al. 2021)]|uniref:Iron only hydrogenase large subunit, C-terminal domain protein n=1 Tax=Megasphaera vaginalis (ex Srinivasan et al. 2021) TaxID=1111454 RepID=U7USV5_9FIRM|nr:[Fe-Fe] hydrogenase large subunit C-terminal domain-containing protein [Megasphaera vaginalis (ex Srinivasan et al. 2021)]ERT62522.1 iron only hydrogenase large subunit, C-terminal domain protein [Megasphaera vaginalis (ex Srinivasan et al. 2021)]
MDSLDELYYTMLKNAADNKKEIAPEDADPHMVDCLAKSDNTLIFRTKPCLCPPDDRPCIDACAWDAVKADGENGVTIDQTQCVGCQACVDVCALDALKTKKDIIPVVRELHEYDGPVYALVAPAISGQFGPAVTLGKVRTALKKLGFTGVLEVAAFADILTLKEALEFDRNIHDENDFQLTSCCCPMWIAMIKKLYHQLLPNVPGSVSPMIAGGRTVKALHPQAKTVFIGPCMAKKSEKNEPDLAGAIDYVLTYQELSDLLTVTDIDMASLPEDSLPHASKTGICYAYAGGVAAAVKTTLEKLNPQRAVTIRTRRADGVPACKAMINDILAGKRDGNFFEGMGCIGGCVGGPRAIIGKDEGKEHVQAYGDSSHYETPMDNPYVIEMLKRLGFTTIEEFLTKSDLYDRNLDG